MLNVTKMLWEQDVFTPHIRLIYEDFKPIQDIDRETMSCLVFQAKSKSTGETHHIRAFNSLSLFAQQAPNKAITIFLQETLRLCSLRPDVIVPNTLEFHENKICYAVLPIISPVPSSPSNLNISRLLECLIGDLKHLMTHNVNTRIIAPTIYELSSKDPGTNAHKPDELPLYLVHDWNRVFWTTAAMLKKKNVMESNARDQTIRQKKSVYQLALTILEIGQLNRRETDNLLANSGENLQKTLNRVLGQLKLPTNDQDIKLLSKMLDKEVSQRPNFEEILEIVKTNKDKKGEEAADINKEAERKNKKKIKIIENTSTQNVKQVPVEDETDFLRMEEARLQAIYNNKRKTSRASVIMNNIFDGDDVQQEKRPPEQPKRVLKKNKEDSPGFGRSKRAIYISKVELNKSPKPIEAPTDRKARQKIKIIENSSTKKAKRPSVIRIISDEFDSSELNSTFCGPLTTRNYRTNDSFRMLVEPDYSSYYYDEYMTRSRSVQVDRDNKASTFTVL